MKAKKTSAASTKPIKGENSSALKTLVTCSQSTPEVPEWPFMNWLARPTPRIEPIIVCEEETGRPRHQVARFQSTAATSKANTIEKPEPADTLRMSSTGSRATIEKATAPELVSTPRKFQKPDQTTAIWGSSEWV